MPPAHGNTGAVPHNALTAAATETVVEFMLRLAEAEGVPNPRFSLERTAEDGGIDHIEHLIHLPACYTYNSLYVRYSTEFADHEDVVKRTSFLEILKCNPRLQNIKLSKRTRGLCERCKDLRFSLQGASSDVRASSVMEVLRDHLQAAHDLRQLYQSRLQRAGKEWTSPRQRANFAMISFDYAVQLVLPYSNMQTQNEYMGTRFGLDVNLFGISNEGAREHHNFMYTEGFGESVISIVHHYLSLPAQYRVNSARKLAVYTDSCSGQNRNKFMHAYFIHRILRWLPRRDLVELYGRRPHQVFAGPWLCAYPQCPEEEQPLHDE